MYRCFNYIEVQQQPTASQPFRDKLITLDYLNRFEAFDSWQNLTNTATITLPKNVIAKDLSGNEVPLQGTNINIGFGNAPLFLRGDTIKLFVGYWYKDELGSDVQDVSLVFDGYINKVKSNLAISLECEDKMWILKQTPAPDKVWGGGLSLQQIITECIANAPIQSGIKVVTGSQTKVTFDIGTFFTKGETVAQVLARIRRDLKIGAYIKGNELRIGYPTYYPSDVENVNGKPYKFVFQKNIISDNLDYMRKDDIIMSATATSFYSENAGGTCKDGATKTRKKRLMVFIWADRITGDFKSKLITKTSQIPANEGGERYTFFFPFAKTQAELTELAINELNKKYYTGFKGTITTFGIPHINTGNNIIIEDEVIPDRNGTYKVKGVTISGGAGIGIRQVIHIDYKIDV